MKKIYTLLVLISISFTSLFSQVEGTWTMAPEAVALGVGPALNDFSWWSNSEADVTTRACFFDDRFVFNADGSFSNEQDGETWLEPWQGVAAEECGAPVAPHDGSNAATWTYDAGAGTITLTGLGAHLGLPKVINDAEIDNPANAASSITYPVVIDGDRMTIDINFGPGFWHFVLVRTTTSVVELVEDQFSFYPNPATSEIQITSDVQFDEFTIRDITGRVVLQLMNPSTSETIDISALAGGMYLLESRVDNQKSIEKLIVR